MTTMNGFVDRGLDEGNFGESGGVSFAAFDAFPKTKQTYLTRSRGGGIWTIITTVLCIWLTFTEIWRYMSGTTTHSFSVEKGVAHDMQINLDIVVAMSCDDLHVNLQDASGDRIFASEKLTKDNTRWDSWSAGYVRDARTGQRKRRDAFGSPQSHIEASMEQKNQYLQSEDVHEFLAKAKALRRWGLTPRLKSGEEPDACRLYGSVEGNKVQGDFHITARGHGYMEWGAAHLDHQRFNFSHHINELSFGPYFPSMAQPLSNTRTVTDFNFYKYQYFMSIVPTIYTDQAAKLTSSDPPHVQARNARDAANQRRKQELRQMELPGHLRDQNPMAPSEPDAEFFKTQGGAIFGASPRTIYTNQYAVTEQSRPISSHAVPGLFFKYDIEPVLLTVGEEWGGLLGLVIKCVNVVAGVLVAGGWLAALTSWVGDNLAKRRRRMSIRDGLLSPAAGTGGGFYSDEKSGLE